LTITTQQCTKFSLTVNRLQHIQNSFDRAVVKTPNTIVTLFSNLAGSQLTNILITSYFFLHAMLRLSIKSQPI